MRAAVLTEVNGPFELRDVPEPIQGEKVLVRVRAAGINFADVLVRRGRYPQMPELPVVLGSEIAGELEDGTRVMALTSGSGGYAELVAVDRAQVVPLPDRASFAEGASFLVTFLSAYIPLTRQVRVRSGSTVLVYAAAGGVGTATIQVARALGGRVIAAVGSAEKIETCLALGADSAYVYDELPDDLQVDVVVDPVGGELFAGSFARLKPLGAVVAIGSAAGAWATIDPARIVGRNVGLYGFFLGRLLRLEPEIVGTAVGELLGLWETGAFTPLVGAELPLGEVERAHELVESRKSVGKVVLVP
ncbi:MAG: NADPH:quinone reductase [Gaiellaceae bacterium]|nr:NADPH:quinone reductase [Gaiellaceae bacterium]MDX6474052.1 NADPH:quinone reductase [Gaiellaceae bacterium]